ncbi:hypothetical protein OG612_36920 [Streptomyces sp. NBC_01527]|nr:hypothetical protein OG763_06000 [Streptomyces sp. NBC_01230]
MRKAVDDRLGYLGTHVGLYQSRRAGPDVPVKESFGAVRKSSGRP